MRADFVSDNASGIAPEALRALVAANEGFAPAYGRDALTAKAGDLIRALLDADVEVYFCTSGTAANALGLTASCSSLQSIVAHEHAHLVTEEAGAPAFFGNGLGLICVPGASGRIDPKALRAVLERPPDSSGQSPGVLSLSNATEYGTVYPATGIEKLAGMVKAHGLHVHLDGARLANAAAAGFDLKRLKAAGVDVLSLGGAKSGMPPTEALVFFNRAITRHFRTRLKQAGQLTSKSRFCTAPWVGMLESGAWVAHARHANAMAARLAADMPFEIAHPVESNAVFARIESATRERLTKAGWATVRFPDRSVRFMCSWATTVEGVAELIHALKGMA